MLMDYALRAFAAVLDLVARRPDPAPSTIVHLRQQAVVDAPVHTLTTIDDTDPTPPTGYRHDAISEACDRLLDLHR